MLTARKQWILQTIVDGYVHTMAPVSSTNVAQKIPVAVSPATVRNDMADLEEDGYIICPHASGGDVPSDKGYRAYVESLGDVPEPSQRV